MDFRRKQRACPLWVPSDRKDHRAMAVTDELYEFAFCYEPKNEELAALAADEDWGPGLSILKNYVIFLFKRAAQLQNRKESLGEGGAPYLLQTEEYACFDTGLYTDRYESIYALFVPNRRENAQPWFLEGFFKTSDHALNEIPELPQRVRFTDNPADLIYDYRLPIRVNVDHILGDESNLERIPEALRGDDQSFLLHRVFEGAVSEAERRAAANYMLAVPQYYNGRIQLLLPLCLTSDEPEIALAIQRENGYYAGRTCLTLEWAYSNARLIARPEASWIAPARSAC